MNHCAHIADYHMNRTQRFSRLQWFLNWEIEFSAYRRFYDLSLGVLQDEF